MDAWTTDHPSDLVRTFGRSIVELILGRDITAAIVRLLLLAGSLAFAWLLLVVSFNFPGQVPYFWLENLPPLTYPLLNVLSTFFHPDVLLHMLPLTAGMLASLIIAAAYLADLFELESVWIAFSYLLGAIFGLSYPRLRIDRSDVSSLDPSNPLKRIGGPGFIRIHLGFAAVFEDRQGRPKVYALSSPGADSSSHEPTQSTFFIEGFERLRDVVDLRDRLAKVDLIRAETAEGVRIYARDAQMLFRICAGEQERSLANPYPYTEEAVRRLVYGRPVVNGKPPAPETILAEVLEREIREFVSQHTLEEILALQPYRMGEAAVQRATQASFQIPRRELTARFHTPEVRARLRDKGLELAWVGVGTWDLQDPVGQERNPGEALITTWRNFHRLQLFRDPEYIARQQNLRYQDRLFEIPQAWVRTWGSPDFPGAHRDFALLSLIREQLRSMHKRIGMDLEPGIRQGLESVRSLLETLVEPRVFGEAE